MQPHKKCVKCEYLLRNCSFKEWVGKTDTGLNLTRNLMPAFGIWQCAIDTFQQEEGNPSTPEIWANVLNEEGNIKKPNVCMPDEDLVFATCFSFTDRNLF